MVSLQTHNNSGRKKLVITKAPEAKQIMGKDNRPLDFIEFLAKVEGEDSAVKYSVWSKALNDYFKLDAVVECDVVVTDQKNVDQDGNPYKNRKITQVFQDGSPVKQQQKQWGKSPETVAMEIDGKFRDTALMQAGEHCRRYIPDDQATTASVLKVADKFYAWLKGEKPSDKAQDKGMVQSEDKKATVSPTESQEGTLPPVARVGSFRLGVRVNGEPEFKDGTDLVNYALKHGFKLVSIKETLGIKTPADIKDVAVAAKTLFSKGVK